MAYLIWIGTNRGNAGGTSAKGYWVHRRGTEVIARWGAVESTGARGGTFTWLAQQGMRWSDTSESEAKLRVAQKIAEKIDAGYDLLPPGRKIE